MDHPNIWKFIDGIHAVQKGRDFVHEEFIHGDQPIVNRRKYVAANVRIKTIVDKAKETSSSTLEESLTISQCVREQPMHSRD